MTSFVNSGDIVTSKNHCSTKKKIEKFDFLWTIENFSYCHEKPGQWFISSPIKFEKNDKIEWYLKIYPNGTSEETKDYIALYLGLNKSDKFEIMAKKSFSILNKNGEKRNAVENTNILKYIVNGDIFGSTRFIERSQLFDKVNNLLPGDKLTIFCEIFMICDSINSVTYLTTTGAHRRLPKITKDIENMIKSPKLSDCTIKVDDTIINAHKFMLASRSEVFYAMFNNKCLESQSHEIEIKDFRLEVVEEMINYIYTDNSPNLKKMAKEILSIAEKYNLQGLKTMAEETLISSIDIKNICEYLEISEIYSAKLLKEKCIELISMNISNVVGTNNWNKLVISYPLLLEEIIINMAELKIRNNEDNTQIKKESKQN